MPLRNPKRVRRLPDGPYKHMWEARCKMHREDYVARYWDFGATLGNLFYHIWKEHRYG